MPITLPLNTLPPFTLPTILIDTWKPFYKGFHTTPVIPQRLLGESIVLFFFLQGYGAGPNSRGIILGTSQLFEWFMVYVFLILSIIQFLSNVIFTNNLFT